MKKVVCTLGLVLMTCLSLVAQKFEGKITYGIEYTEIPEMLEAYESMLPKESSMTIKNEKSKATQTMMGGSTAVISDTKTGKAVMLMDMMGMKIAVNMDDLNKDAEEKKEAAEPKIVYCKETKKIAGYNCKKATVASTDGENDTEMVVWYTEELPKLGKANNKTGAANLPGFPMEYSLSANEMEMTMTVTDVSKESVADTEFETPEGYEEMTMEDFQEKMGGMGGMGE